MKWGDKRIPLGNQQGYELAESFRWYGGVCVCARAGGLLWWGGGMFNSFVVHSV